jgi:hypothetical protein
VADLAFSLHALVISSITLLQVFYYAYRNRKHIETATDNVSERTRLIPLPHELHGASKSSAPSSSTRPSIPCQIAIAGIVIAGLISGASVWAGRTEWLDFASSVKLFVTLIKYVPQVILNTHLRSIEGFAIENILLVSDRESSDTPLAARLELDEAIADMIPTGSDRVNLLVRPTGHCLGVHRARPFRHHREPGQTRLVPHHLVVRPGFHRAELLALPRKADRGGCVDIDTRYTRNQSRRVGIDTLRTGYLYML